MVGILDTIKKMLGIDLDNDAFDVDIIVNINSAFMVLNQLGVGNVFSITDNTSLWTDYLGEALNLESIKTYIFLKVKLVFDPPPNSFLVDAIKREIEQWEWRLMVEKDPPVV